MKRKNLVAMGLAGVMAVGMCMPVMAADMTASETSKAKDVEISLKQVEAYEVTLPANISSGTVGADQQLQFKIENAKLTPGYQISIKVDNTKEGNAKVTQGVLELSNTVDATKKYSVKLMDGQNTVDENAIIAFTADNAKDNAGVLTKEITVTKNDDNGVAYAGTYKGVVNFAISYGVVAGN